MITDRESANYSEIIRHSATLSTPNYMKSTLGLYVGLHSGWLL